MCCRFLILLLLVLVLPLPLPLSLSPPIFPNPYYFPQPHLRPTRALTQIKLSNAKVMFDFIADVVQQFLDENGIVGGRKGQKTLKLGFTFSYPVDQTALDYGTLMHWNKGFDVKGVVGKDVAGLLRSAFQRKVRFLQKDGWITTPTTTLALEHRWIAHLH